MFNNEERSVSRAPSFSKASHRTHSTTRTSTISRARSRSRPRSRTQSLVKKNVAPTDLRPSDILIDRFVAWKAIVKQLIAYFEGVADIESNVAREYTKLGAVVQVPFKSGTQFLGEGGLQDVFYTVRDKARHIADQHANLARTVDSSIVQHLQKLRTEIKAHIKNIQNDTGKLATSVAKERELSARMIGELATATSVFKNTPMNVTPKSDPYVINMSVSHQLQKQIHEENALQKSIIIMQQNSAHFEEGIVRAIQSAWATFAEWRDRSYTIVSDCMGNREWIAFAAREDHLLDPETPLRNPSTITYPGREDPAASPVHAGYLERKKRFTRTYRESFYVLTAAGFLHEYPTSDPTHIGTHPPMFSLFLPACTLGPPSASRAKSHKFHIEGSKDGEGFSHSGSIRRSVLGGMGLGKGAHAWAFRARSREDMMEWWNDIRMLCARYLVASEQIDRGGPVEAAVRSAGYVSEEEDEEEGEEGSSVEESDVDVDAGDEGEEGEDDLYQDAETNEEPPSYSHPGGPNGYAKDHSGYVSRQPSQRQLDKAPEGRSVNPARDGHPLANSDKNDGRLNSGARTMTNQPNEQASITAASRSGEQEGAPGPAPVESRFTEEL
ncbi:hypothetical protein F5J12DRAFT_855427 [Pisolithus orientalis]|uniref:uncharacterized protein n=1 Tax=Pisolithus orientalis TaxID=936130 RepID=UPI0022251EAC|nr:uncharacterized protein F5J12DRAFT_855427 [Pisolithus orientalis]KAI5995838.1 hypothetical protein F5J12DRAFT_855427 [Pisolithus orientalis]